MWEYWAQEIGNIYQTYWAIKFYFPVIKKEQAQDIEDVLNKIGCRILMNSFFIEN
jgi:hypothetical protein